MQLVPGPWPYLHGRTLYSLGRNLFPSASNQHMARLHKKTVYLLLYLRIDHHLRPLAIRTGESWRRSEQAADQRAYCIDLASIVTQVRAAQIGKRRLMFLVAFDWKPCHLFRGGGYRPAAIVTTGFALERGNMLSEKPDFLAVACHCRCYLEKSLHHILNPPVYALPQPGRGRLRRYA